MKVVAAITAGTAALLALVVGLRSLPDVKRYLRMRSMCTS